MYFCSTAMKKKSVAVVIVSNGPGELATWVKPLVNELITLKKFLYDHYLKSLVKEPHPNVLKILLLLGYQAF